MDTKLREISELDVLPDNGHLGHFGHQLHQPKRSRSWLQELRQSACRQDWTPLHLAGVRDDEDAEAVAALLELRILASPEF